MQFNSLAFFCFFAISLILYYSVPVKKGKWLLLLFSLYFYSCFSWSGFLGLLVIAVVSWIGEVVLEKARKKELLLVFVALTLFPLIALKYMGLLPGYVLPVGISFFTLQAVSGMVDVYKQKSKPSGWSEHTLYLSFFPTVVSGPIIRKNVFLAEIRKTKIFVYEDVRRGLYRIAIGFVEKFFLADRIGKLVDYVYGNSQEMSGVQIVVATVLFGLQLYYDFAGYSHMAIGFAKCFGITIMENFERPYFSVSIKEFWRRWHMSLSSWLRDYVYIPLGGSRKGTLRRYINLVITFMVSGVWHGVGVNFLFWGFLHGVYQVIEDRIFRKRDKKSIVDTGVIAESKIEALKEKSIALLRMVVVFVLVDFAWLFFRASDMATAIQMVNKIVSGFQVSTLFTTWWFDYGMSKLEYLMWIVVALGILFFDIMEEKDKEFFAKFEKQKTWLRWSVYAVIIFVIVTTLVIGMGSDTSSFLYQNF